MLDQVEGFALEHPTPPPVLFTHQSILSETKTILFMQMAESERGVVTLEEAVRMHLSGLVSAASPPPPFSSSSSSSSTTTATTTTSTSATVNTGATSVSVFSKTDVLQGSVVLLADSHAHLSRTVVPQLVASCERMQARFAAIDAFSAYLGELAAAVDRLEAAVSDAEARFPSTLGKLSRGIGSLFGGEKKAEAGRKRAASLSSNAPIAVPKWGGRWKEV